jgi:hypothetical protein
MALTKNDIDFLVDCCDQEFRKDNENRNDLMEPLQTWLNTAIEIDRDPDNHYTATIDSIQETWEMALYMGIVYGTDSKVIEEFLRASFVIVAMDFDGAFKIFVGTADSNGPQFISIMENVDRNHGAIGDNVVGLLFSQEVDMLAFDNGYLTNLDVAVIVSPAKEKPRSALANAQANASKE